MVKKSKGTQFRNEHICGDEKLVEFNTGFRCYVVIFKFLGSAVNHLNYWGSNVSEYPEKQKQMMKIDPNESACLVSHETVYIFEDIRLVLLIWNLCKCCFKVYNHLDLFHVP